MNGKLYSIANSALLSYKHYKPQIWTAVGVGCHVLSVAAAIRGTWKFKEEYDAKKPKKPTRSELAKMILKHYTLTGALSAGSIGATVSGMTVATARLSTAATAASIATTKLKDLREAIKETDNPKKVDEVNTKVAEKELSRAHTENVYSTGRGTQLFYDPNFGILFRSTMDRVKKSVNYINELRLNDKEPTVSDLYYDLNIEEIPTLAEGFGWSLQTEKLSVDPKGKYIYELDEAAIVLEYDLTLLHPEYYNQPGSYRW